MHFYYMLRSQNHSQNQRETTCIISPRQSSITTWTLGGSRPKNLSNRLKAHSPHVWNATPLLQTSSTSRLSAYSSHLTPIPSFLCPHCLAQDRLHLWKPVILASQNCHANVSEEDVTCIFNVMSKAWSDSMQEAYSSSLLAWHVHCDKRSIPEPQRAPAHPSHISSFIVCLAGSYSGSAISNYIYRLQAWHILHRIDWKLNYLEMDAVRATAELDFNQNLAGGPKINIL